MKAKKGRPKLPKSEARGAMFSVRLQPDERKKIDAAAKRDGEKVTEWARKRLLECAVGDIL